MMPAELFGWLAQGCLSAALGALLARRLRPRLALPLTLAAGSLAFLPLPEIGSLAAWLHGVFGAPSMTLVQLALLTCLGRPLPPAPGPRTGAALLALGIGFHLAALGLGPVDPYGWGFQPLPLLAALLPLLVLLYLRRQGAWLGLLTGNLLAYTVGLYANLWNALLDPILVLILAFHLARRKSS
ncbi:hypothetical protein [Azovibrio restrictus]|uniref:hypothetical protein n=1 Tax=Azovibrio restrictus TaxID=146938 RepID=UPI0026EA15CF|nr:hypothetical protein [Azovibrio restrictus]